MKDRDRSFHSLASEFAAAKYLLHADESSEIESAIWVLVQLERDQIAKRIAEIEAEIARRSSEPMHKQKIKAVVAQAVATVRQKDRR